MKMIITKRDLLWNYIYYFVNFGTNIILVPFMFHILNKDEIGLWYIFLSVSALSDVFDFGFSAVISRNISFIWSGAAELNAKGFTTKKVANDLDFHLLLKVLKTSKVIYNTISMLVFIMLLMGGTFYIDSISREALPRQDYLLAWFIFIVAVFLNIKFSFWNYVLKGIGAIEQSNKSFIISKLTQLILMFILLGFGFGITGMSLAYLISTLTQRLLSAYYFRRYESIGEKLQNYKGFKYNSDDVASLLKNLLVNSYKQGIITLTYFALNKSVVFISSIYLDLATTGKIGFTMQLFSLTAAIGNSLFNTYLPQFTSDRFNGNTGRIYKNLTLSLGMSILILFSGGIFLILFGNPIFELIRMNTSLLSGAETFVMLISFLLINSHFLCGAYIASANNLSMYRSYFISSAIMVVLQITLSAVTDWGVWALILPMFVVQSTYNNWKWPVAIASELGVPLSKLLYDSFVSGVRLLSRVDKIFVKSR
jgi:O-antigen/teichoic acid export membrane protein